MSQPIQRMCTHRQSGPCVPTMDRVQGPKPGTLPEAQRPAWWVEDRGTILVSRCLYCKRETP